MSEQVETYRYLEQNPERLDKYLANRMAGISRARIQAWIKNSFVLVDGEVVTKTGFQLGEGATIAVHRPLIQASKIVPRDIPLDIIYEDDDLIVVNKPAGMVVHPSSGHVDDTLINAILAHAPEIEGVGGELRPGVVHRLDKDTSGLILLAKNDATHVWLQNQFRSRKVNKVYLALVDGAPPTANGRIEAAIGRATSQRKLMAVVSDEKGRQAISEYYTLERFPQHTLLEVRPTTGRTHQIRLHLKYIGCPVAGDRVYGQKKSSIPLERHFLHAQRLSICLPGETNSVTFEAPLPQELEVILERLRQ